MPPATLPASSSTPLVFCFSVRGRIPLPSHHSHHSTHAGHCRRTQRTKHKSRRAKRSTMWRHFTWVKSLQLLSHPIRAPTCTPSRRHRAQRQHGPHQHKRLNEKCSKGVARLRTVVPTRRGPSCCHRGPTVGRSCRATQSRRPLFTNFSSPEQARVQERARRTRRAAEGQRQRSGSDSGGRSCSRS